MIPMIVVFNSVLRVEGVKMLKPCTMLVAGQEPSIWQGMQLNARLKH
jgi:hypothetical protein